MINIDLEKACLEVLPVFTLWREQGYNFDEGLFLARLLLGFMEATRDSNGDLTKEALETVYKKEFEYANAT